MKSLTKEEMMQLYCGLFATANALRKLGDEEGRAAWCDCMGDLVRAKFLADDEAADESPWRSEKHPGEQQGVG